MSTDEKSLRIIEFSGKAEHWDVWSEKFLARGKRKGYAKLLLCKKNEVGVDKIPTTSELAVAESGGTEADKRVVKVGELNEFAYEDLILSINGNLTSGKVAFNLVKNCKSESYPEGNCKLAWDRLTNKYAPKTAPSYIKLKKDFTNSRLDSAEEDPDEWLTNLESLRNEMDAVNISGKMGDLDFIIHVLANLPEEYEVVVQGLEDRLEDPSTAPTVEQIRTKLNARYKRLIGQTEKSEEEKAFAAFRKQFKGTCNTCGKYGHKGVDCPDRKENNSEGKEKGTSGKRLSKEMKSQLRCYYCKKKGHVKADCWKWKAAEKAKNAVDGNASESESEDELGFCCRAETEIEKEVRFDENVTYIQFQDKRTSEKHVRFDKRVIEFQDAPREKAKAEILWANTQSPAGQLRTKAQNVSIEIQASKASAARLTGEATKASQKTLLWAIAARQYI